MKDEGSSNFYECVVKFRNQLRKMAKKQRKLSVESTEGQERFDSIQDDADLQLVVIDFLEKVQQCIKSYKMQVNPSQPAEPITQKS